ncbi:MAG TPA: signal peptidase I [Pseudonocardia sp.]|jgi:hypothetical protein
MGAFAPAGLRRTDGLEVKWADHPLGDTRREWAEPAAATTLTMLVAGHFRIEFPDGRTDLAAPGDYALFTGVAHSWTALAPSTVVTIRWPSQP